MQFIHHDLGQRRGGEIVEITLSGSAANVRLMDSAQFENYRSGREHTFHGGLATKSPVRMQIPHAGAWYVAVDMQGLKGTVHSTARILPGPLGEIREAAKVPEPSEPLHNADVFICHASEDRDNFVRPLAHALTGYGLSVLYEECELKKGDILPAKLDAGFARCRFGVIVLSRSFFAQEWTDDELDDLAARVVAGEPLLLPIWHEIARRELFRYSHFLAENAVSNTGTQSVAEIAAEICEAGSFPAHELTHGFRVAPGDWCPPGFRAGRWGLRC
jgi:hypothetical protein